MDLPVHNQILWYACVEAERRLGDDKIGSPMACYPYLVCGSWMNDMNQSSIFTDFIGAKNKESDSAYRVDGAIDGFFKVLWIEELKALLERMGSSGTDARGAAASFRSMFPDALSRDSTATASFGKYCRYDHLDVLENNARNENASWKKDDHFVSETIKETVSYIKYSFLDSSFDNEPGKRLSRNKIIALGRSLHTFADFYAHSNYVELLLWSLAFADKLKPGVLNEFNSKEKFPENGEKIHPYCPLPTPRDDRDALLSTKETDNFFRVLWYGPTPQTTPLNSCRFLFTDTAYSLLTMYATYLERVDTAPMNNDTLNLAMSVFNVPGKDVMVKFFQVYQDVAHILEKLGESAREFLASRLEERGKTADPTTKGALEATAAIIRRYDNAEAKEWAKAGRLKYVAYTLQKDMATPLAKQDFNSPILPHHSLLCKDYLPGFLSDILRYRLACLFATEVTTEFLVMHFLRRTPNEDQYWKLASRYFIHPSMQLQPDKSLSPAGPLIDENKLNRWIYDGLMGDWWSLARNGNVIRTS